MNKLCADCGTNLEAEQEMFSGDTLFTGHNCRVSPQAIVDVLNGLRQNGVPCFMVKDLTTPELENLIMGEG